MLGRLEQWAVLALCPILNVGVFFGPPRKPSTTLHKLLLIWKKTLHIYFSSQNMVCTKVQHDYKQSSCLLYFFKFKCKCVAEFHCRLYTNVHVIAIQNNSRLFGIFLTILVFLPIKLNNFFKFFFYFHIDSTILPSKVK
jgi:hypothetical protein